MALGLRKSYVIGSLTALVSVVGTAAWILRAVQRHQSDDLSQVYDFGEARDGEHVLHVFQIVNPYTAPLEFRQIIPSCRCTVPGAAPDVIPARRSALFPVNVHVTGDGPFQSDVTIVVLNHSPIRLVVRGTVIAQHPSAVSFGEVKRTEIPSREFYLRSASALPLEIYRVERGPEFAVHYERSESNGRDIRVHLSVNTRTLAGPFSQEIRFITNDDKNSLMPVQVDGYVVGPLEVSPRTVNFGLIDANHPKQMALKVTAPYGGRIQLQSVSSAEPAISCGASHALVNSDAVVISVVLQPTFRNRVLKTAIDVCARINGEYQCRKVEVYAMKY